MHISLLASNAVTLLQVIILARESGLKLELSDLSDKSLVPEPLKVRTNICHVIRESWIINALFLIICLMFCRLVHPLRNLCRSFRSLTKNGHRDFRMQRMLGK